jgi:hypothetical protein
VAPDFFKRYGIAGAILAALVWLMQMVIGDVRAEVRALGKDVDFLSRMVDLSCQPAKPVQTTENP